VLAGGFLVLGMVSRRQSPAARMGDETKALRVVRAANQPAMSDLTASAGRIIVDVSPPETDKVPFNEPIDRLEDAGLRKLVGGEIRFSMPDPRPWFGIPASQPVVEMASEVAAAGIDGGTAATAAFPGDVLEPVAPPAMRWLNDDRQGRTFPVILQSDFFAVSEAKLAAVSEAPRRTEEWRTLPSAGARVTPPALPAGPSLHEARAVGLYRSREHGRVVLMEPPPHPERDSSFVPSASGHDN
jgi:hypothetical protein